MDVCLKCAVIGAGITGAAVAYALSRRGAAVHLFEQFDIFHERGSSHGATRLFRMAYFEHPDYVPLLRESLNRWLDLEQEAGEPLLRQTGVLMAGPAKGKVISGIRQSAASHDIAIDELARKDQRTRFPWFHIPGAYDAIFEPAAGFILADSALQFFITAARDRDAVMHARTPVIDWRPEKQGVSVLTAQGSEHFDRLIITPGAWANRLLKLSSAYVTPLRKRLFWAAPGDQTFSVDAGFPPFGVERDDNRFFYGFPAINHDGVKVGEHTGGTPLSDPAEAATDTQESIADVQAFLKMFAPALSQTIHKEQRCLYEMSSDGHFIIDTHPEDSRVAFAAGLSGHGFKFAPVIGEALADLASLGEAAKEFDFLSLKRFAVK